MIAKVIAIIFVLLIGWWMAFLWKTYEATVHDPCQAAGEREGLFEIKQFTQEGSNYGAICGGFTAEGRYRVFNSR
jgi:hypothetical protein